jgi:hypothetical protein
LVLDFTAQQAAFAMGVNFAGIGANFTVAGIGTPTNASHTGDFGGALVGSCTGAGCASPSVTGSFGGGMDGPNGYELAVVGGGFYGTVAGPVVFLNAYESSTLIPPTSLSNMTGQLTYASLSPSVANTATLSSSTNIFSGTDLIAYGNGTNFPSGMLNSGTVSETGSTALADSSVMYWGRWTGPSVQVISAPGDVSLSPPTGVPYVIGDASTTLPTSGTFTYAFAGGPNPVDTSGTVGTFNGGAFSVSFGSTSGAMTVAIPLSLTVGGANFSLTSCTSGCTFSNSPPVAGNMILSGTCSGGAGGATAPTAATGNAAGVFVGPQGAGLAVAGNIMSPAPTVSFAAGFKR